MDLKIQANALLQHSDQRPAVNRPSSKEFSRFFEFRPVPPVDSAQALDIHDTAGLDIENRGILWQPVLSLESQLLKSQQIRFEARNRRIRTRKSD